MVYLFHFERPVDEATWPCVATAYRSYEKSVTLSEVDAAASGVMHLSGGAGSAAGDAVTFLSFFYVNTSKGTHTRAGPRVLI